MLLCFVERPLTCGAATTAVLQCLTRGLYCRRRATIRLRERSSRLKTRSILAQREKRANHRTDAEPHPRPPFNLECLLQLFCLSSRIFRRKASMRGNLNQPGRARNPQQMQTFYLNLCRAAGYRGKHHALRACEACLRLAPLTNPQTDKPSGSFSLRAASGATRNAD